MRFKPDSIFNRLLLAFLFVGVFTGGPLVLASIFFSKDSTLRRSQQSAVQQIDTIATGFEQEFGVSLRRAIKATAASETLNAYVTGTAEERILNAKTLETSLLRLVEDFEIFSAAYYADADGNLVVSVADGRREPGNRIEPVGKPGSPQARPVSTDGAISALYHDLKTTPLLLSSGNMEWFMPPREVSVKSIYQDENERLSFLAGVATLDHDNGAFGGAVMIRVRLDKFVARLKGIQFLDENPVWLVDGAGEILMRPDNRDVSFDPRPHLDQGAANLTRVLNVGGGLVAYRDVSVVPGKPFLRIAYAVPSSVLNRDFVPTMRFFALVLAVSTLMVLATAYWISRNLSDPIVQLAEAASRLASGDTSARVKVRTTGELAVLVDSFNQMSSQLQLADRRRSNTFEVLKGIAFYLQREGGPESKSPEELRKMLDEIDTDAKYFGDSSSDDLRTVSSLIVKLFHDREEYVREIREAIATAEEANRAKSDFLATMSHEIRTPLNAVIGLSDVLVTTTLTQDQRRLVETMESAGRQLLQIINDVLDFSRLQAGKVELDEGVVDLHAMVERLMFMIKGLQGASKKLDMTFDIAPAVSRHIMTDGQRLTQILTNLLGNAVKYTEKGSVRLEVDVDKAEPSSERLVFRVRDTGRGVPQHLHEKIFEPFKQAGSERFEPHAGSGLGLAICRRLARAMGGDVRVSESGSGGSCFVLELPLKLSPNVEETAAASEESAGHRAPLRILVAEDTPASQLVIQLLLQRLGHSVRIVGNGKEAVEAFSRDEFDVVILDVQMPVMNGYEAAQAIRSSGERGAAVPLVVLTAFAQNSDREEALAQGINAFVSKPVKAAEIKQLLADISARRPRALSS